MAITMKRYLKSRRARTIAAVVAIVAVGAGAFLFIRARNAMMPEVTLTTVTRGQITRSVTMVSDIEARSRTVLSLSPAVKVVSVLAQEGQEVRRGDILVVLDTSEFQSQLDQQYINLSTAESTLAYISGASSAMNRTSASGAASQADIALQNAESNLSAAQQSLEDVRALTESTVSRAEIALTSAQSNRDEARRNLESVERLSQDMVCQARIAADGARDAYRTAHDALTALKDSLTTGQITQAEYDARYPALKYALDSADTAQRSAQVALSSAETTATANVSAAEKALSDAELAVTSATIDLTDSGTKADSDLRAAEKAVSDASNAVRSAQIVLSEARAATGHTNETDGERISNQQGQIALLNANIDYLNGKVEQGNLRSNVDGVVTRMDAVANQYPEAGDEVVVDGTTEYVASLDASQYDAVNIRVGQRAQVTLRGISGAYEGVVSEIGELAEPSVTSTDRDPKVNIGISITNPDENVKVGYEADTELFLDERDAALQLSIDAVLTEPGTGKRFVFTVDGGNRVSRAYVETGVETDYFIEILSGLVEGQRCISNPDSSITEGIRVRVATT